MHWTVNLQITKVLLYSSIFILLFQHLFPTAESQGLGGVRVCRMGDTEQCKELVLGWVVNSDNKQEMAVRTGDGWRKILVSNISVIVTNKTVLPSAWRHNPRRGHKGHLAPKGGGGPRGWQTEVTWWRSRGRQDPGEPRDPRPAAQWPTQQPQQEPQPRRVRPLQAPGLWTQSPEHGESCHVAVCFSLFQILCI